ncbi:MAG: sugar phosphate nucleotidyltransferase [Thermodesulfobacteriota bacterium]
MTLTHPPKRRKAMVLAAGLGTRLAPRTDILPKPLFPIGGTPVLGKMLMNLHRAGFSDVVVNVHHLAPQVETYVRENDFGLRVRTVFEPLLLGTGGGMKNVEDFFDDGPFLAVNADVVTDLDLRSAFDFHLSHSDPATMVFVDCPRHNQVLVHNGHVISFSKDTEENGGRRLTFTGIQVMDPSVLSLLPKGEPISIIEAYRQLLDRGESIRAIVASASRWHDMGSFEGFDEAALLEGAERVLPRLSGEAESPLSVERLSGDGSDRRWYRVRRGSRSVVCAAHGMRESGLQNEADAFFAIGRHLATKGAPAAPLLYYDSFSGHVFCEDLGDRHLAALISENGPAAMEKSYRTIVSGLARMAVSAAEGFDTSWTWQTPFYDESVIVTRECGYFLSAFVNGYLGRNADPADFSAEFSELAARALEDAPRGFLHRDMQSRNIMARGGSFFFIDYAAARLGPLAYDLASLLLDPYAGLPRDMEQRLVDHYLAEAYSLTDLDPDAFRRSYGLLALCRNLQVLGAFSFLSRVKGKPGFEPFIPAAVRSLKERITAAEFAPRLSALVSSL